MSAPSPIHRDPEVDGDDYGCLGRNAARGNTAIAKLVADACSGLSAGVFLDGEELIAFVRRRLTALANRYDCGCCDTIVKENIFAAIYNSIRAAGIKVDQKQIYGW